MRLFPLALVFVSVLGSGLAEAQPKPSPIKVTYDAAHLDLDKRELQFKTSRKIDGAKLVVIGDDGSELGTTTTYKPAPGGWLAMTWTQPASARVLKLRLRVEANDGVATNVELIPWSVSVDHEDVKFATDSAVLEPGELAKLDASLAKIEEVVARSAKLVNMQLFVAGHTDTVGATDKNRKLSLARASAIAKYFRSKGLKLPIAVAGYGEEVLKVKTGDSVDEARNRRADYVLGPAGGAPPFKGPYLKVKVGWASLK